MISRNSNYGPRFPLGQCADGAGRSSGCLAPLLLLTLIGTAAWAQATTSETAEREAGELHVSLDLLEREPFFELTLDAENGNRLLEIQPLDSVPADPKASDRLHIHLLSDPETEYEVTWQHIARLRTYDQLVFEKARELVRSEQFDEAFPYFDYLLQQPAVTPEIQRAFLEYILANADVLARKKNYQQALAYLEEVTRRDGRYRAAEVASRVTQVAESMIAAMVRREDYPQARGLIDRLEKTYGKERLPSLDQWRQQMRGMAVTLLDQARQEVQRKNFRMAEQLSRRVERIWPQLPGASELRQEIARQYPMVLVGVAEAAGQQDVRSLANWPARRTGWLTQRTLVQFIGAGPEGGQYLCPLGSYYQSDDRRQLTLQLADLGDLQGVLQVDGYDVSRRVLEMADPASPLYEPAWASLIRGTVVEDIATVHINLRRPHVLPEAMLQFQLDVASDDPQVLRPSEGPYVEADSPDGDVHFVVNPRYRFPGMDHPAEIVERYFRNASGALGALRRGDIDVIDCLFPDDAARLRNDESLQVVAYALPTIHVLTPSRPNPFLQNQMFRRALVYGINRQAILDGEVLGNQPVEGCRVISGPFPLGARDNDPLAYAYDVRIKPRAYYPRLASVLKTLAYRSLREMAKKRGEAIPDDVHLVIGHPPSQLARVSCQAISQYLQVVGIECELRELPPGRSDDPDGEVDLLYQQVAMWEPLIDARRLLAPGGVAQVDNEYVGMALRRLDEAKNWREVRTRLHDLHRIVHEQVSVIPLWQTVNFLAYNRRLSGVGKMPLTLYQDVEQWRVLQSEPASGGAGSAKR